MLSISGFIGYQTLIKESLPDLEIPQATIITEWPGSTPDMVEKEITRRLENSIKGLKGLKHLFSASRDHISIISVGFEAEMPRNEAMLSLQRTIGAIEGELPKSALRPRIEETSVRDYPIATVALFGNASTVKLEARIKKLRDRIKQIPGIRKVNIIGENKPYIRIQLMPERLRMMGVSATRVRDAINYYNNDAPWGQFENEDLGFSMKMTGLFESFEDIRNLPLIRLPEGNVIRVKDVATVSRSKWKETAKGFLSINGEDYFPVTALNIFKGPGKDTIRLVEKVREVIEQTQQSAEWDESVRVRIFGDEAKFIKDELNRGFTNAWQSMLAVFVVLFFMLSWREALIAAFSVPLTLLGTVAVLWAMGYTFNLLVIVGMVLALGLLVDDFILIMEGMHENIFIKQLKFTDAVRQTIKTYAVPSFSGSVTTILVMIPLVFIGGIDGKFIKLIPITTAVCLVISYIVSVMIGPPISRFVLNSKTKELKPGLIDRLSEKAGDSLSDWLKRNVVSSRLKASLWLGLVFILILVTLDVSQYLRNSLYPKEDGRGLGISIEFESRTPLEKTEQLSKKIAEILRSKPYLEYVFQVVGAKDSYSLGSFHDMLASPEAPNYVGFTCFFVKRNQREKLSHLYVEPLREEIRQALEGLPGIRIVMTPQTGGPDSEDPIQIDIIGDDMDKLKAISHRVQEALQRVHGVSDVRDNIGEPRFSLGFRPIREAMEFHKISQSELGFQMIAYMLNEKIGVFRQADSDEDLDIRLQTGWPSQENTSGPPKSWAELMNLSIINDEGTPVPLWSITEPTLDEAQKVIVHKMGRRSITVRAKTTTAYAPEVIAQMRPVMEQMQKNWPDNYHYIFAGEQKQDDLYETMFKIFLIAMLLVFAILALLFDSLLQPVLILFTVVFGLIGVVFGFFLAGIPFSFSASIGIVALVGIVVNDAIIMIDTMNNYYKNGSDVREAALRGAADRLRPIVSTTVTNFAGLTPLALSDPAWSSLCWAIIFGEITATLGALIILPALYTLVTPGQIKPISLPAALETD